MAVELAGITLEHLTALTVAERPRLARHSVPGMQGDLAQSLGRASVEVTFQGIFYGPTAADDLTALRRAVADQGPVDFFTEATGEGYFSQVLLTDLTVSQRAGELDQFDYACTVREYVEPPAPPAAASLADIDAGLLDEAAAFMDDVQGAIDAVAQIADMIASIPSFGDPTERLGELDDVYAGLVGGEGGLIGALTRLRELFV